MRAKIDPKTRIKAYSVTQEKALFLRDMPLLHDKSYVSSLDAAVDTFLSLFTQVRSPEPLSEEGRAKMRNYLEKIFEAKDVENPRKG